MTQSNDNSLIFKKKILFKITVFFFGLSFAISARLEANHPRDSPPTSSVQIQRSCYSLDYDCRTKNAIWVYERLSAESLKGNADRKHSSFKEDLVIPDIFRSTLSDYKGSGFDRGHLAPAADHTSSQEAMSETFFLSNMSPQVPELNRGYWSKLEKHVRDLTKTCKTLEVFTGPLYLPEEDENGIRWVKYQVIGKNDVAVPTHFFKVMVAEALSGEKEYKAYILPNKKIDPKTPLEDFGVTVQKVEKLAGFLFPKS